MPQPCPAAGPEVGLGVRGQAVGGQDEQEGQVGRGLVQDARGVAHGDAEAGGLGHVDVVVPHRGHAHHPQPAGARRPAAPSASIRSVSRQSMAVDLAGQGRPDRASASVGLDDLVAGGQAAGRAHPLGRGRVTRTRPTQWVV